MRTNTRGRAGLTAAVAAALLLAGAGCSDDTQPAADATSANEPVEIDYTPIYATVPCDGELFAGRFPTDPPFARAADVECGTLAVPEDRTTSDSRDVVLPVAILRTSAPDRQPDPYVYFSGGPGDAGIEAGFRVLAGGLVPTNRDFIWFDQRGTGRASPSLYCEDTYENQYERFATADSGAVEDEVTTAAYQACLSRLADVADLSQYDTPTTAHDVADLHVALALDEWNIFGISYGTTVALEVLRSHPSGVRSAVIDGVYPPDEDSSTTGGVKTFEGAIDKLFAGCAADDACHARYPDLEGDFAKAAADLDATPYPVSFTDVSGKPREALITGQDVVGAPFLAMYDSTLIPLLPSFIHAIAEGNYGLLDALGSELLADLTGNSDGQSFAIECADRAEIMTPTDMDALREKYPTYGQVTAAPHLPEICDEIDVDPVEDAFHDVSATDIPTLVLTGEYDPVTPPPNGERVAKALGGSATAVVFPALGHGATRQGACPQQIFWAFLDDPTAQVDTSCVATMGPPAWAL